MATDWAQMKVIQLKAELRRRGLPYNGLKGELVARLDAADNEDSQLQEEEEEDVEVEVEEAQPEQDEQPDVSAPPEAETGPAEDAPEQIERPEPVASENPESPQEQIGASLTEERASTTEDRIATPDATETLPGDDGAAQVTVGDASKRESSLTPEKHAEEARAASSVPPESASSTQKRKQRSASPTPNEEDGSSKRLRKEETTNGEAIRVDTRPDEAASALDVNIEVDIAEKPASDEPVSDVVEMDYERDVPPAVHPATPALYISKLMRPIQSEDMQAHLANLASSTSQEPADDIIVRFFIDQIRTHAFVVFHTTSAASRVRTALHDAVWPNESNRKALSVDFVPPEKVNEWIETEELNRNGRSGTRWEVIYHDGPDGTVEAILESTSMSAASRLAPPSNNGAASKFGGDSTSAIPVGPRSYRDMNPPTGPRAVRAGTGPGPRPPPSALGSAVERTQARPNILFQLVSEDIAQRRIDNMRSFYVRDKQRDFGREINRYSFEDGDSFVDRGKEVFEGIRPPHRERAVERERRGGGGGRGGGYGGRPPRRGPPPFRPRSDRYLPGREDSNHNGDDRRSRYDDDRSSRYSGDWDRDFRSNRR